MKFVPALAVIVTLAAAHPALAQWGRGWGRQHASTAAEGYQRGMADVIRSRGAANLMNSAAMKNVDARTKYIDNRLRATKTYFEMKRYNKDYRDATDKPRPTSEQLFRLAKEKTPGTLAPADLDPVTGNINWPDVLMSDGYEKLRGNLEALYADRANAGGKADFALYQEIRKNVRGMQGELKKQINDIPPQTFSSANAFLKRLEFSAHATG